MVPLIVMPVASAHSLIALLVAMFPANVRAARMRLMVAGRPAMALTRRVPLQLFWIGARRTAWIA